MNILTLYLNFFCIFLFIDLPCSFAQKQKNCQDGKFLVILEYDNIEIDHVCKLIIYKKEIKIKEINLYDIISGKTEQDVICFDFIMKKGEYLVLIENLNKVPILFFDVKIKKDIITYFPINLNEMYNINSVNSVIIKDYADYFKIYLEKHPPIVQ
jgi:hypothetical protein